MRAFPGSIRLRLIAGFAAIAIAMAGAAVYFGNFVEGQRAGLEELRAQHEGFFVVNRVASSFTPYQAAVLARDGSPDRIRKTSDEFHRHLADYARLSPRLAAEVRVLSDQIIERAAAVRDANRAGDPATVGARTAEMRTSVIRLGELLRGGFDEMDHRYKEHLDHQLEAQQQWELLFRWSVGLAMIGLLLYLGFLGQTILQPLGVTVAAIRALRKGNAMPALPRQGEFGQISQMMDELRDATQRLRDLAFYDTLTGLSSRARFEQMLAEAIAGARRNDGRLVVVLIELQRLREIASAYGPAIAERCLRSAGERALFAVPPACTPSRYGEMRLAYFVSGSTPEAVTAEAFGVLGALRAPLAIDGLVLQLHAQAGIARFPEDGADAPALLGAAETALVSARGSHTGSVAVFDPAASQGFRRDLQLLQDVERGLGEDEFIPHFHSIVDCSRGEVIAAEALARWRHPLRGLLAPAEFLPTAERTGQVAALDARVLDRAIACAVQWRAEGKRLRLAFNLSPRYLSAQTVARLEGMLRRHRLPADQLMAELTETAVIAQGDETDHVIHSLHTLGATICLDDFGTGYSSLSYVHRLPIGQLKVDRSFVSEIGRSLPAERIIEATLSLARSIGIAVIAEGVETREQMMWLMQRGCMVQQGFLFSRPQPAESFLASLAETTRVLAELLNPAQARQAGT